MQRLTDRPEITPDTDLTQQPGYSMIYKRLAEYESAEEQGKLMVINEDLCYIASGRIFEYISPVGKPYYRVKYPGMRCSDDQIFMTKEAASAALK